MNRKYSIFVQAPNHYCHPRFWAEINGDKCVFERKTGVCGSTGPITLIVGDSGLWEAVRNSEREGGGCEETRKCGFSLYLAPKNSLSSKAGSENTQRPYLV